MSTTNSQAFCAKSSSNVVSIPTRYDRNSNQRVIRWKDIQQCFKNPLYIMCGEDVVLSLTDDNLEDLIPLRIAHHPGVVLEVVLSDDDQRDPSTASSQSNDSDMVSKNLVATGSRPEVMSATDSQALVVHPQSRLADMAVQWLSASSTGRNQEEADNKTTLQEQLQQLQQQMKDVLEKLQQTDEQTQGTEHRLQDQIDKILQTSERMDREHIEVTQRLTELSGVQQPQEVLQTLQQFKKEITEQFNQKTQVFQQQTHDILSQLEQKKQEQQFLQLLQHLFEEILRKVQQPDQLKQQVDMVQQEIQQTSQQEQTSQRQHNALQQLDDALWAILEFMGKTFAFFIGLLFYYGLYRLMKHLFMRFGG
ncbi:MAG: hypothetical protein J3Q66DRAFT_209480 [Benniella sp.]|nr:MAG: hypothetical protein J3Q66DRAFT_209480 [Benniella sp.]